MTAAKARTVKGEIDVMVTAGGAAITGGEEELGTRLVRDSTGCRNGYRHEVDKRFLCVC